ncbi:helix-turn-helix domain-containing protein [Dinoroseobacter sp. S124A]|uniref:helix-turn-helix domain-containing protein n=1 Tax=Dinoroseobacter sp. S124A TaxID=3415128 RepID=UPI003C7DF7ED
MLDFSDLQLTRHEAMVLAILVVNRSRTIGADEILKRIGSQGKRKTCSVHICRIRKALKGAGCPLKIETVYGVGYRLRWFDRQEGASA